jgi:hypothetical protein
MDCKFAGILGVCISATTHVSMSSNFQTVAACFRFSSSCNSVDVRNSDFQTLGIQFRLLVRRCGVTGTVGKLGLSQSRAKQLRGTMDQARFERVTPAYMATALNRCKVQGRTIR